jgi:hypothetical protein
MDIYSAPIVLGFRLSQFQRLCLILSVFDKNGRRNCGLGITYPIRAGVAVYQKGKNSEKDVEMVYFFTKNKYNDMHERKWLGYENAYLGEIDDGRKNSKAVRI